MIGTVPALLVAAGSVAAFMLGRLGAQCVPRGKGGYGPPNAIAGLLPRFKAAQAWYIVLLVVLLLQLSGTMTGSGYY